MIDVKELRVGNLLKKDGVVVTIDARSIFDIWDKSEKYEAIEINEEWLRRFGFDKKIESFLKGRFDVHKLANWTNYMFCEGNLVLRELKYVHTIQNLYFALTGKELQLKN